MVCNLKTHDYAEDLIEKVGLAGFLSFMLGVLWPSCMNRLDALFVMHVKLGYKLCLYSELGSGSLLEKKKGDFCSYPHFLA